MDAPTPLSPTMTYAQFTAGAAWSGRLRAAARDSALRLLAAGRRIDGSNNWIRFPYYHHVFDDERPGFARQLDYLANFGEFIAMDDAVALIEGDQPIDGRYFSVSFDDGFRSCITGALPILAQRAIPALFYVVCAMVGRVLSPDDPVARDVFGFKGRDTALEFLTWEDCRSMSEHGMAIGSHSLNHVRLARLDDAAVAIEMRQSKAAIENEMGAPCLHFCPPYGVPEVDFLPERDAALARAVGYRSLATGCRGPMRQSDDPFSLRRDHFIAGWGTHQLRYFFSLS